jgi:hypothetical protein
MDGERANEELSAANDEISSASCKPADLRASFSLLFVPASRSQQLSARNDVVSPEML